MLKDTEVVSNGVSMGKQCMVMRIRLRLTFLGHFVRVCVLLVLFYLSKHFNRVQKNNASTDGDCSLVTEQPLKQ